MTYLGGIKRCSDCKHFKGYSGDDFAECPILSKKANTETLTHRSNGICENFEYKDYLKFRLTEKIDSSSGEFVYSEYLEFLKEEYEGFVATYEPYDSNKTYVMSLQHDYCKWVKSGNELKKVQHLFPEPYTMKFNYVKVSEVVYHVFFNDFKDLSFLDSQRITVGAFRKQISKRKSFSEYKYQSIFFRKAK